MPPLLTFTTDRLRITPWADEVIDRLGFDPRSPYVEQFWLGVLGPSTTWLLRRLAAGFDAEPDGFELPLVETARALGLGDSTGRSGAFLRTVNRMVQFGMAVGTGNAELAVRRRIPPLPARFAERLPPSLQEAHRRWQQAEREPPEDDQRRRCRQLALSLVELGEDAEAAERQLLRWRYHPGLAHDAAAWASAHHHEQRT
ncbi:MAG: hypothetical protein ACYCUG_13455 [Acidimicrobiales bacterium]